MLSLLWPSLAETCRNTKLTFDLHSIHHAVLVSTVDSDLLITIQYGGGLPSGHETHATGSTASHVIRLSNYRQASLQTEAMPPSLVMWWEWRLINLTLLLLHSVSKRKRRRIHLLTDVYICDLRALPISPRNGDRESLSNVSEVNHDANIIPKSIFSITHWSQHASHSAVTLNTWWNYTTVVIQWQMRTCISACWS